MGKPTKNQKDKLKAETDKLKTKLESEGHIVRNSDLTPDDERLVYSVEFADFPGEVYTVDTPAIGPPHPETGVSETAEEYAKRGGLEAQIRHMREKRQAGKIGPR